MQQYADYKILILAEEEMLKERLVSRKEKGGSSREEAEAWYQNSDSKNVTRVLRDSLQGDLLLKVEEDIKDRISHVVIMGIGEPFDNYDNVMDFINIINDAYALAIGIRHITVSTSGIVPKIKEFAKEGLGVNLAISLHAPNNEIRNKIMKINKAYDINELIESVKEYLKLTNRRVTFEYIMLKGVNDTDECAKELANLLKGINCYVNIIPYNETNNIGFKRSLSSQITKFCGILKENNINVTIRREFGSKVSAACGQLRSKIEEENK